MEINDSFQLGIEQCFKALIPYLQALPDAEGTWDFLDAPFPNTLKQFAGHESEDLAEDKTDYVAFIAELPKWLDYRQRVATVAVRMEIATGGIADNTTRAAAVALHSQRTGALIQLFSPSNFRDLLTALNTPGVDWAALGFTGWEPLPDFSDGRSTSGNSAIARIGYRFTVFRAA